MEFIRSRRLQASIRPPDHVIGIGQREVCSVPTISDTAVSPSSAQAARSSSGRRGNGWIEEIRRADLHGAGAGDEKFHHVVKRTNPADADHRHAHLPGDQIDQTQRQRLDRRTAQAPRDISQDRLALAPVDRHADKRIHQRHRIRPAVGRRLRDRHNARHVRRQFGDQRQRANLAHFLNNPPRHQGIGREIQAARNVGARQVQFQARQSRHGFPSPLGGEGLGVRGNRRSADLLRHLDELIHRLAGDVGNDRGRQRAQVRQMMFDEVIDPVIVQPDGVQHARGRLHRSRRRIANARQARNRLGNDAAQPGEIDRAGHLTCVAKCARRHEDGILQSQTAESDGEIHIRWLTWRHAFSRVRAQSWHYSDVCQVLRIAEQRGRRLRNYQFRESNDEG